ncbi:MAG: hypothetical protein J5I59_01635 [Saprospiraceae bacterium]|nr:hypothetical protein [Saprospiraceae bacterium]
MILPLIGLYFDKKGIDFRQGALKELNQRIDISSCAPLDFGGKMLNIDSLKGSVWVLFDVSEIDKGLLSKIIQSVYAQNNGKNNLRLVTFGSDTTLRKSIPDYIFKGSFLSEGDSATFGCIKNVFIHQDSFAVNRFAMNAFIIDSKGVMRRGYELTDKSTVQQLIRHLTVLLPEYKREKPTLIRQEGY